MTAQIDKVENGYIVTLLPDNKVFIFKGLAELYLALSEYFSEENIIINMIMSSKVLPNEGDNTNGEENE